MIYNSIYMGVNIRSFISHCFDAISTFKQVAALHCLVFENFPHFHFGLFEARNKRLFFTFSTFCHKTKCGSPKSGESLPLGRPFTSTCSPNFSSNLITLPRRFRTWINFRITNLKLFTRQRGAVCYMRIPTLFNVCLSLSVSDSRRRRQISKLRKFAYRFILMNILFLSGWNSRRVYLGRMTLNV